MAEPSKRHSGRNRNSNDDNKTATSAIQSVTQTARQSVTGSVTQPPKSVTKSTSSGHIDRDTDHGTKPASASRIKVFWTKVKKSMAKGEVLPYKLLKYYNYMSAHRNEIHEVYEAVRTVVIGDPAEITKAQGKQTPGPFQPSQAAGLYEKLFAVVEKKENKKAFHYHENFDNVHQMIRELSLEERSHQKATEKIFADMTRFLEVDYPKIDAKMEVVYEAKKVVEEKDSQVQGYPAKTDDNNVAYLADKAALKQAEANFDTICFETKKMISAILETGKGYENAIAVWVSARGDYHEKMEKIMAKAGVPTPDDLKHENSE